MSEVHVPEAQVRRRPRFNWVWLLPIIAVIFAGWIGYRAWSIRGVMIQVQLQLGHGLKPGDEVRYRGITVGKVTDVALANNGDGIVVTASLQDQAGTLACAGSRFWVVRPRLRLTGVEGLETLVGPRHLSVLPGDGAPQREFIGLTEPPVVDDSGPLQGGGLEVILLAPQRGSLARGAPVVYRQVQIGRVMSVGLTSDAGAVEARLRIDPAYSQLIRDRTIFWDAGGLRARIGFAGLDLEIDSLEAMLVGSVGIATPPTPGELARTGHRFMIASEAPEDWVEWEPLIVIGNSLLPPGAPMPNPQRAKLAWRQGMLNSPRSREGWVLQTSEGLLGPTNLLCSPERANEDTAMIEVAGGALSPQRLQPQWERQGLALLEVQVQRPQWSASMMRSAAGPEDIVLIGNPTGEPLSLAATRFSHEGRYWRVDPVVPLDSSWHGACVIGRSDGSLIGMLLVEGGNARVALLE